MVQEQLTAARAFAKQEVEGVESSALDALEALRVEYQGVEESLAEEAEKIEADLAVRDVSYRLRWLKRLLAILQN